MKRIAIVGASLAGLTAARTLREHGFRGELTVIGAETRPPYNRTALVKTLLSRTDDVSHLTLPQPEGLGAHWLLGTTALRLDGRSVVVDQGPPVPFDGLVVTCGVRARSWSGAGRELPGVFAPRTIDDVLALKRALAGARKQAGRVVVLGGGLIAADVATAGRRLGLDVTLVDRNELPLARAFGPEMATWVLERHERAGVRVLRGVGPAAIEGRDAVEGVRLTDGRRLPADVVVAGLGSLPNVEWLSGSGLRTGDGLLCTPTLHAQGRTDVVAAGDVARWPHPLFDGELTRIEHWYAAIDQARLAARNLLMGPDRSTPCTAIPWYSTAMHGDTVQLSGLPHLADERVVVDQDGAADRLLVAFGRRGRAAGAVAVNAPDGLRALHDHVAAGTAFAEAALTREDRDGLTVPSR